MSYSRFSAVSKNNIQSLTVELNSIPADSLSIADIKDFYYNLARIAGYMIQNNKSIPADQTSAFLSARESMKSKLSARYITLARNTSEDGKTLDQVAFIGRSGGRTRRRSRSKQKRKRKRSKSRR